jgi:hypothetical protein
MTVYAPPKVRSPAFNPDHRSRSGVAATVAVPELTTVVDGGTACHAHTPAAAAPIRHAALIHRHRRNAAKARPPANNGTAKCAPASETAKLTSAMAQSQPSRCSAWPPMRCTARTMRAATAGFTPANAARTSGDDRP